MDTKNRRMDLLKKTLNMVITAYILVIMGILPLYHKDGFYMIGDIKYRFFYNTSVYLLPVVIILILILAFSEKRKQRFSKTDVCVLGYGIVVCISYVLSSYKDTALYGYTDWHMGLITQLILVGIYIVVSRAWKWDERIVRIICAVSGFIFLLGLLNRYAVDPLQMYGGLEYWNKTHLLATIGNINWYCGYFCVLFPIGFYYYWKGSSNILYRILSVCYVAAAFGTMVTQGSESGLAAFAVIMFLYFLFSFESNDKMQHYLEAHVIFGVAGIALKAAYYALIERAYFGVDLPSIGIITSSVWEYYAAGALILYVCFLYGIRRKQLQADRHLFVRTICVAGAVSGFLLLLAGMVIHAIRADIFPFMDQLSYLNLNEMWGSGRGLLWPLTWQAFWEMPFWNQLFGVGPDCFAPYMYTYYGSSLQGFLQGWWGDAVVANAHNEWLNTLVNTGVFGLLTYMGIMVTAIIESVKKKNAIPILLPLGMSIVMYMVNNTASFQQVVSTPLIFVIIGMAENKRRNYLLK